MRVYRTWFAITIALVMFGATVNIVGAILGR
jgi:hypothetical protein